MKFNNIVDQVIILFLMMVVGYAARNRRILDDSANKVLSEIVLNITFPFMIIASFNYSFSRDMLIKAGILLMFSVIIHISLFFISKFLYFKYPNNVKSVLRFITVFSNCGFMGFPIVGSVYGKVGVFYTAVFNIPFNVLMWTLGVMLFTSEKEAKNLKKAVINPGLVSTVIGVLIFVFSIKLPVPIYKTFDLVGAATTPLSMIVIGAMIANISIREVFRGSAIYYGSIVRLVATPLAVFLILKLLGIHGMLLGIPVLITAMPGAANTAIMAEKYNADTALASRCVFITSVLSVITIPLIMLLIQ